jgi:hypothetical protein
MAINLNNPPGQYNANDWYSAYPSNSFGIPFGLNSQAQKDASAMKSLGPIMSIAGMIGSIASSYYGAKAQQYQLDSQAMTLQFQKDIAGINARQAEVTAQGILQAGEKQSAMMSLKYGKAKGSQRAAMAASGGVIGEGSNKEIEATNDLMKEIDILQINANTVRSAENARTQSQNYLTQAAMYGVSANNMTASSKSIDPFSAAGTSLLTGATSFATTMYRDKMMDRLLARQIGY